MNISKFKTTKLRHKWVVAGLILLIGVVLITRTVLKTRTSKETTYQTTLAEKGTVISSISASGTISSGNSTSISTKASGTVRQVYVNNGGKVKKGEKIAELSLDEYGIEKQSAAYLAYTNAQEAVKMAVKGKTDADIAMWQTRQTLLDAEDTYIEKNKGAINPITDEAYTENERALVDKTYIQAKQAFEAAELRYINANSEIADARAKVTAAWRDYEEVSATIIAPATGVVQGLTLASGVVIADNSTTSTVNGSTTTTVSSKTIGQVNNPDGQLQATVNLSQMDITKVIANQKVTLTLDAFTNLTFTGKVLAVNTSGNMNSNVVSYPVTILLDHTDQPIYPNMSVSAQIITDIKTDVISIPTTAINTVNGESSVEVIVNKNPTRVKVTLGIASDTHTEITSGLSVGDEVVTATITPDTSSQEDDSSSPFNRLNRNSGNGIGMPMGGPPGY